MDFDALFHDARAFYGAGNLPRATAICDSILAQHPDHSGALYMKGMIAFQQGDASKALPYLDKAVALVPQQANIQSNHGLILQTLGRLQESIASYDRAIAIDPAYVDAHFNRGIVLQKLKRPEEAIASYDAAIALDPRIAEAYLQRGCAREDLSKLKEALADYDTALTIQPNLAKAHYRRAFVLYALGRMEASLQAYDRTIALQPDLSAAHCNRGHALRELGRLDEAKASYERALALRPDNVLAKKGLLICSLPRMRDPAMVERLSVEVSAAEAEKQCAFLRKNLCILDYRVFHDMEYTDYLIASGYKDPSILAANACLREICARNPADHTPSASLKEFDVTPAECDVINNFRRTAPRYQMPLSLHSCLNEANDWAALEEQYLQSRPEVIFIDNMLSQECLAEFRKFCLLSHIWRREYTARYLGTTPEEGFVSPLQLQMAAELQKKMPRIFGGHDLTQLWAFKYSSTMGQGINVHADFARVNLNFWLTPDEANLDPSTGGLVVYDVPAPPSWTYQDYNQNEEKIFAFLKQHAAGSRRIPYRCNRAVLFNSNLFHATDTFQFKPGYQNRRINVTYLFGRGLQD